MEPNANTRWVSNTGTRYEDRQKATNARPRRHADRSLLLEKSLGKSIINTCDEVKRKINTIRGYPLMALRTDLGGATSIPAGTTLDQLPCLPAQQS